MKTRMQYGIQNLSLFILLLSIFLSLTEPQNIRYYIFGLSGIMIFCQCFQIIDSEEIKHIHIILSVKMLCLIFYVCWTKSWYTVGLGLALIDLTGQFTSSQDYEDFMAKTCVVIRKKRIMILLISIFTLILRLWGGKNQELEIFISFVVVLVAMGFCEMEFLLLKEASQEHKLQYMMQKTALGELHEKNMNQELELRYQLADTNARLEERESIARNIHNVVGHTITSAIVTIQASEVLYEDDAKLGKEKLEAAEQRMRMALEEIRRAVRVMDKESEKVSIADFRQILSSKLEDFVMDTQIRIQHNLEDATPELLISKRFCEFFHSVLAEGLSNGIRHGEATAFLIHLEADARHIKLQIHDNGTKIEMQGEEEPDQVVQQGYGLKKIDQFTKKNGGKMSIETEDGFTLTVELPLNDI